MNSEQAKPESSYAAAEETLHSSEVANPAPAAQDAELSQYLLDVVANRPVPTKDFPSRLDRFLKASTPREALQLWFGATTLEQADKGSVARKLNRAVATIDQLLNQQLNEIIHHRDFQKLEASWRGLEYLAERVAESGDPKIKIRVLNARWRDLERDFERAVEFDQSQVFKKVYEEEFGTPGGEPYGVLIADYAVHPSPAQGHPHDDMSILRSLSRVGAASFCPVLTNADASMFGMDTFSELEHNIDHARTHEQHSFLNWRSLRDAEDARFLGVALPRVLMRLPYEDDGTRIDEFCFREDVSGPDAEKYLWGGAAFAMGEVLIRSFADSGWLADIRGQQRDQERGGMVTRLPSHSFSTDKMGVVPKSTTDVVVTEDLERQLSDLGFLPLCHCKDTEHSVFYSSQSIQKPKKYDRTIANVNARISSMLQYMFCVSRFAHYVKVIARDKVGSFQEASEFESYIQRWIVDYVTADSEARVDVKARRPLRDAKVSVQPIPGKPGSYHCTMHLAPHYELDELSASVKLVAELSQAKAST